MGRQLLTASRVRTFNSCHRLHHYKYDLCVRPNADAAAAHFGTLFHAGLEAWWPSGDLDLALAAMRGRAGRDETPDLFELARAEALLIGYDARWAAERGEVIGVEIEWSMPLVNPETGAASRTYRVAGKLDALTVIDGRTWLVEHKTSSQDITPGSEYWQRLRIDSQVSIYFDAASHLGYDIAGCLYDVILRPQQHPYKATPQDKRRITKAGKLDARQHEADETPGEFRARVLAAISSDPDRYYQRGTVVRLEDEMADYRWEMWQVGRAIRETELAQRFIRNPDACANQYGRLCAFFDVCTGAASIDDPHRFRRDATPHPELSARVQQETDDGDEQAGTGKA